MLKDMKANQTNDKGNTLKSNFKAHRVRCVHIQDNLETTFDKGEWRERERKMKESLMIQLSG